MLLAIFYLFVYDFLISSTMIPPKICFMSNSVYPNYHLHRI